MEETGAGYVIHGSVHSDHAGLWLGGEPVFPSHSPAAPAPQWMGNSQELTASVLGCSGCGLGMKAPAESPAELVLVMLV